MSILPLQKEFEIPEGEGFYKTQQFPEGGRSTKPNNFSRARGSVRPKNFLRVKGFVRPNNLKKCMKLNLNFQGVGRVPSMGEVWMFSATTHYE